MTSKRKHAPTPRSPRARTQQLPPLVQGPQAGPIEDFDALLGKGDDLWADEVEFEAFLAALARWRKEDREPSRQS